ncbi:MAG: F0F1 ATP synthase subunit B' [Campylobacteraceae bacterium]|nr:F0F1 ATP synthase subunit B' [Campylobacteraceae bacterium]
MLDISPILMLSSGGIFLLILLGLNTYLFKPLLKHMDDRAESIKSDLLNAKSNSADVDGMLAEANNVIAAAKKEAAMIREQAFNEAKETADAKLEAAKSDIDTKYSTFIKELSVETIALRESLLSSMPQFTERVQAKLKSI